MWHGLLGIGVVGYGYWGPNLVRNFSNTEGAQVIAVSDLDSQRLSLIKRRHPGVIATPEFNDLLRDGRIDALAIATPVHSHYDLALAALRAGKHVFIEKPLAETSDQVRHLIEEAERRKLILMVDHTFLYTPAVQKIRELIAGGDLGDIYYYNGIRVSLGLFQSDVNVIWDMAHITLFFQSSCVANVSVNWLSPVKVRQTFIGGSRKMIVYDDLEATEKIKVYDKGITVKAEEENAYQLRIGYRAGDMWAPHLPAKEALQTEAEHFIDCVRTGKSPISNGITGLLVVEILEAASLSIAAQGQPVRLTDKYMSRQIAS
jgi:predicted dehydrogenase